MTDHGDFWGEPIHVYTRAQGIDDGVLVDVSEQARDSGFKIPVALTATAFADCCEWSAEDSARKPSSGQTTEARLRDLLYMARLRASQARDENQVGFQILRVPREGRGEKARTVDLKLHIGPGDQGEPVITIMFPSED